MDATHRGQRSLAASDAFKATMIATWLAKLPQKKRSLGRKNRQNNSRRGEDTPTARSDTDLQSRRWSGIPPVNRELRMHKKAFTPDNAAMLLIDHQLGTISWTHSHDINLVRQNAIRSSPSWRSIGPLPMVQS
jgi:hypothetical protein